eukprot:EG_transcript_21246
MGKKDKHIQHRRVEDPEKNANSQPHVRISQPIAPSPWMAQMWIIRTPAQMIHSWIICAPLHRLWPTGSSFQKGSNPLNACPKRYSVVGTLKIALEKKQIFDHFQLRGKQVTGGWVGGKSQMGMTKTAGVDDRKEDSPWAQETGCHRAERQSSPVGRV